MDAAAVRIDFAQIVSAWIALCRKSTPSGYQYVETLDRRCLNVQNLKQMLDLRVSELAAAGSSRAALQSYADSVVAAAQSCLSQVTVDNFDAAVAQLCQCMAGRLEPTPTCRACQPCSASSGPNKGKNQLLIGTIVSTVLAAVFLILLLFLVVRLYFGRPS